MATQVGSRPFAPTRSPDWTTRPFGALGSENQALLIAGPITAAIVVGMAAGITPLTVVASLGALAAALVAPYAGLAVLAFMVPLVPPSVIPAPGFTPVLVGAILLGCIYRLPIDRPRIEVRVPLLVLVAFLLFVTVQQLPVMLGGYAFGASHRIGYLYIQLATLAGIAVAAAWVLKDHRPGPVLAMCTAGACFVAALAIASPDNQSGALPLARLLAATDEGTRAVASFGNPNYFGHFLAAAIAASAGLVVATDGRLRLLLLGALFLTCSALTLSLSRGAIAALLVGLLALAFSRSRVFGLAVLVIGLAIVMIVYPAFVQWRLEGISGSASSTAYQAMEQSDSVRQDAVLAGPQLFLTSPLVGVGFGQYSELSSQFTTLHISIGSHNWYMSVLAEQGVIGAVLWLVLLGTVLFELRSRPAAPRRVGIAALGVFATGSLFVTQPVSFQTAALPVIVIAAALVGDWTPSGSKAQSQSGRAGGQADRARVV